MLAPKWASIQKLHSSSLARTTRSCSSPPLTMVIAAGIALLARLSTRRLSVLWSSTITSAATPGCSARASLRTTMSSLTRTSLRTLFHRVPNSALVPDADKYLHCRVWCYRPDGIQSLSFALCHVYARCTRSISVPAPVYCKYRSLFLSNIASMDTID